MLSLYKYRYFAIIMMIIMWFPLVWYNGRKGDGIMSNIFIEYIWAPYIIISVIAFFSFAVFLVKNKLVNIYPRVVKSTIFIYLFHIFVIHILERVMYAYLEISNHILLIITYFSIPILTVIICMIIYNLMDKYCPRLLAFLVGRKI